MPPTMKLPEYRRETGADRRARESAFRTVRKYAARKPAADRVRARCRFGKKGTYIVLTCQTVRSARFVAKEKGAPRNPWQLLPPHNQGAMRSRTAIRRFFRIAARKIASYPHDAPWAGNACSDNHVTLTQPETGLCMGVSGLNLRSELSSRNVQPGIF